MKQMCFRFVLLLTLVLCASFNVPHPLKLSTTRIYWNKEEKCAEVAVVVFADDFQNKLNKEFNSRYDVIRFHSGNEVRQTVSKFFSTYIKISLNKKNCDWVCFNSELNQDMNTLTFFYRMKGVNIAKQNLLELENKMLLNYFPSQVNIVRVNLPVMKEEMMISFKEGYTSEAVKF